MYLKEFFIILFLVSLDGSTGEEDIPVIEGVGTVVILEEEDVLVLTEANFDHVVTTKDFILVEFYAPWCGHCKKLAPEYAIAAKELKEIGIRIGKVDATVHKKIAVKYEINGYPTLKLFRKGFPPEEFDGTRSAQGIIDYMKMRADPNYKPPPSVVDDLDAESFPEFIEEHELSLVKFIAPWCGHCKTLAPEYEAAALELLSEGIHLGKVDAIESKDIASDYKVTGYPTLFIFRKGRKFEYKGPRDRVGIVSYMKNQAFPPSHIMTSVQDILKRAPVMDAYIFSVFDSENVSFFQEYISAASEIRDDFLLMHSLDDNLASKLKLEKNSINIVYPEVFHSEYETKRKSLKEEVASTSEDILAWIRSHITPLVGQRLKNNLNINYKSRPLLVVYYDVDFGYQYIEDTQFIRNKIIHVANRHKDLTFAVSKEQDFMDELKSVGLDDSGEDVSAVIYDQNGLRYPMEPDDFSEKLLEQFVRDYKSGAIKPYLKSKPIPKRQDGPVLSVVANSLDSELMQNEKDVLIEFYAPWCGHCKQLEPVYKDFALYAKTAYPELIVAKMDATANDVPSILTLTGFPTIYFLKGTDKADQISYEGKRTLEGLKDFIKEHTTLPMVKEEL